MSQPKDSLSALENVAMSAVIEQRRRRRWGIFFKLVVLIYITGFIVASCVPHRAISGHAGEKHTALVDIKGAILPGTNNDADTIVTGLRGAFADKNTQAVIVRINSPGGSPVQADYVFTEIKRLRALHPNIKLYAVCSDACASGAYYIASAADDIYANPSSIVGSIGVLMNGFGFVDTLKKVGASRRLMTSGDHKGFLDPFSPVSDWDKNYVKHVLDQVHQRFIDQVKLGRGSRLKLGDPNLFSGLFWTGIDAKKLGLIDGFGSAGSVARDVVHNDNIVDYTKKQSLVSRLSEKLGASFSQHLGEQLGLDGQAENLR